MTPKKVDKQARRIQIYEAAINLFAKKGVTSTTIQDIADNAGIGKGTVYEYFTSKDQLLTDIFTFIIEDVQESVDKAWKKKDNALDRLIAFFDSLLGYFESIPENFTQILLLFWAEGVIQKPGESKEPYLDGFDFRKVYLEYLNFLIETITEGQESGILRKDFDADKLASSLIGSVDGIMFQWFIIGKQINMRDNFMELLRIVISDITVEKNQFESGAQMKKIFIFFILFSLSAFTNAQEPSAREIAQKIDELYRAESSYAEMEMHIVTSHWERTLRMKTWTQGTDITFIRITAPAKEEGVGTLRIESEMWNYLPNTNKVMRIPPSMMMSSWMGSDFNNNDLVQEFSLLEDYNFELILSDTANAEYYYLKATPIEGRPIVWGKRISTVRKEDYIPVKEEYYDDDGQRMRVLTFSDIQTFGDREIPSVMKMNPLTEDGYTTVRYLDTQFNIDIPEDTFSLRNLRNPE